MPRQQEGKSNPVKNDVALAFLLFLVRQSRGTNKKASLVWLIALFALVLSSTRVE